MQIHAHILMPRSSKKTKLDGPDELLPFNGLEVLLKVQKSTFQWVVRPATPCPRPVRSHFDLISGRLESGLPCGGLNRALRGPFELSRWAVGCSPRWP